MLDDLAVCVEPEDVDDLATARAEDSLRSRAADDAVRHDEVALGDDPPDVDVQVRERRLEALEERDERIEAVICQWVVLDVLVACPVRAGRRRPSGSYR